MKYGGKSSSRRSNATAPANGATNGSRPNYKLSNSRPNYNLQNTTTRPNYNRSPNYPPGQSTAPHYGQPYQQSQMGPQGPPPAYGQQPQAYGQAPQVTPHTYGQPQAMPMTTFQSGQPIQQTSPQQYPAAQAHQLTSNQYGNMPQPQQQ